MAEGSRRSASDVLEAGSPLEDPNSYLRTQVAPDGKLVLPAWTRARDQRLREHLKERRERVEQVHKQLKQREKQLEPVMAARHERALQKLRARSEREELDQKQRNAVANTNERLAARARERKPRSLSQPPERIVAAHTEQQLFETGYTSPKMPYSDLAQAQAYMELEDAVRNNDEAEVRKKLEHAKSIGVYNARADCFIKLKDSINTADRQGCLHDPELEVPQLEQEIRRSYLVQLQANVVQKAKKHVQMERALQGGDVRSMEISLQETRRAGIDISVYRRRVAQAKIDARINELESKIALRHTGASNMSATKIVGRNAIPKRMLQVEQRDLRPLREAVKEGDVIDGVDTTAGHALLAVADANTKQDIPLVLARLERAAHLLKDHTIQAMKLEVVKAAFGLLKERAHAIFEEIFNDGTVDGEHVNLLAYIEAITAQQHIGRLMSSVIDDYRLRQAEHGARSQQALARQQTLHELYSSVGLMQQRYKRVEQSILTSIGAGLLAQPDKVHNPGVESAWYIAFSNAVEERLPELVSEELQRAFGTNIAWSIAAPAYNELTGDQWSEFVSYREQLEQEMVQAVTSSNFAKAAKMASKIDSARQLKDLFLPGHISRACDAQVSVKVQCCTVGRVLGFSSTGAASQPSSEVMSHMRRAVAKAMKPNDYEEVRPFDAEADGRCAQISSLSNIMSGNMQVTFDVNVMGLSETYMGFDAVDPAKVVSTFRDAVQARELDELSKACGGTATVEDLRERMWNKISLADLLNVALRDGEKPIHNQHEGGLSQVLLPKVFDHSQWENLELIVACIRKLMPHWPALQQQQQHHPHASHSESENTERSEWELLDENIRRLRYYIRSVFKSCVLKDIEAETNAWSDAARLLLEQLNVDDFEAVTYHMQLEMLEIGKASEQHQEELHELFQKQWDLLGIGRMLRERTSRMLLNGYNSIEAHKIEKTINECGADSDTFWKHTIVDSLQAAVHAINAREFAITFAYVRNKETSLQESIFDAVNQTVASLLEEAVQHEDADTAVYVLTELLEPYLNADIFGPMICTTLTAHMVRYCHWALFRQIFEHQLHPLLQSFASKLEADLPGMVKATAATSKAGGERLRFSLNAGADIAMPSNKSGYELPESTKSVMRETLERSKPLLLRALGKAEEAVNRLNVPQKLLDEADTWRQQMADQQIYVPQHERKATPGMNDAIATLENAANAVHTLDQQENARITAAQQLLYMQHYTWLLNGTVKNPEELTDANFEATSIADGGASVEQQVEESGDESTPRVFDRGESAGISSQRGQTQKQQHHDEKEAKESEVYIIFNTASGTDSALALQTQLKLMCATGHVILDTLPEEIHQEAGMRVEHSHAGEYTYAEVESKVKNAKGIIVLASKALLRNERVLFELRCAIRHQKRITMVNKADEHSAGYAPVDDILSAGPADARLYLQRHSVNPLRHRVADAMSACRRAIDDLQLL